MKKLINMNPDHHSCYLPISLKLEKKGFIRPLLNQKSEILSTKVKKIKTARNHHDSRYLTPEILKYNKSLLRRSQSPELFFRPSKFTIIDMLQNSKSAKPFAKHQKLELVGKNIINSINYNIKPNLLINLENKAKADIIKISAKKEKIINERLKSRNFLKNYSYNKIPKIKKKILPENRTKQGFSSKKKLKTIPESLKDLKSENHSISISGWEENL